MTITTKKQKNKTKKRKRLRLNQRHLEDFSDKVITFNNNCWLPSQYTNFSSFNSNSWFNNLYSEDNDSFIDVQPNIQHEYPTNMVKCLKVNLVLNDLQIKIIHRWFNAAILMYNTTPNRTKSY